MSAVLRATEIWLLLAVAALGCSFIAGADDYRDGYWLAAIACWLVLDVYWAWAARHTKRAIPSGPRQTRWLVTFLVYALYCLPLSSVPLLGRQVVPAFTTIRTLGALMSASGVGFAIWSRHVLAGSWKASVTCGENHSLVQRGPYAIVRHPIYFGFLVAVAGMVLALGEVRAFALLLGVGILLRKMGQEESALRVAFPNQYPEYERRVKRLLPWIW